MTEGYSAMLEEIRRLAVVYGCACRQTGSYRGYPDKEIRSEAQEAVALNDLLHGLEAAIQSAPAKVEAPAETVPQPVSAAAVEPVGQARPFDTFDTQKRGENSVSPELTQALAAYKHGCGLTAMFENAPDALGKARRIEEDALENLLRVILSGDHQRVAIEPDSNRFSLMEIG
jgi:hypothetical protein